MTKRVARPFGLRWWLLPVMIAASALPVAATSIAAQEDSSAVARAVTDLELRLGRDTLVASPGEKYPAGPVHRFFFGSLNRDLWEIEFPVPVLDLDSVGGGLTLTELSGGKQTLGSRFDGADGLIYQFRSIVKDASRAIPGPLQSTPVDDIFQDQMAAQFPLSAMVVAELLEAADVLVAKPSPVIMPDDPRLGEHREILAGRMGWIEVRPNEREGDRPGFANSSKITDTEALYEELRENPASYVDLRGFLTARLVDFLVGDWDRHQGQWRWASYDDGPRTRWEPIPRDRDWAFNQIDGVLTALTRVYFPKYVGFSNEPPDVSRLAFSAQLMDRRLLTGLDRSDFVEVAEVLVSKLTDDVIRAAVQVLPPEYESVAGPGLVEALITRRDAIPQSAADYYDLLASWVDLYGTEGPDVARFENLGDGRVRILIESGSKADGGPFVIVDRTFVADETKEVRIYLTDGDDRAEFTGQNGWPLHLRVVGGDGDDTFQDSTDGRGLFVYDDDGDNSFDLGDGAFLEERNYDDTDKMEERPRPVVAWDWRDWGSAWIPRPEVRYQSDVGLFVGAGLARYGWGFRKQPYESRVSAAVLTGVGFGKSIGDFEVVVPLNETGLRGSVNAEWHTQTPARFFGFGNDTELGASEEFNETIRSGVVVDLRAEQAIDSTLSIYAGPTFAARGAVEAEGTIFQTMPVYGSLNFQQLGIRAGANLDTRDHRHAPKSGFLARAQVRAFPAALDVTDAYAGVSLEGRTYLSAEIPGDPTLHLRVNAHETFGRTPYGELATLGGSSSLPGFEKERFAGDRALSTAALLRVRLFDVRLLTELGVGVTGLFSTGRVWVDGDSPGPWHTAYGGGLWLDVVRLERAVGITLADGGDGLQYYLDFGFLF